jgi:hypothetical protein
MNPAHHELGEDIGRVEPGLRGMGTKSQAPGAAFTQVTFVVIAERSRRHPRSPAPVAKVCGSAAGCLGVLPCR